MMVWLLFIIDLMGLFFYNKIGSIISIGDLPTTNIIEPQIKENFRCSPFVVGLKFSFLLSIFLVKINFDLDEGFGFT